MSNVEAAGQSYVLSRSSPEYQRLDRQALIWEAATRAAIARTGLASGMSAVDLGCGTGSVMRILGEVVGRQGLVIGVDGDDPLGTQALEVLRSDGLTGYRFLKADLSTMPAVEERSFDLVFARLLVVHLPDPVEALRRFWSWVKPGGALLIMDVDMTVVRYFPEHAVLKQAHQMVRNLLRGLGKDLEIGTRMPELFRQAAIGVPDACDVVSKVNVIAAGGGMVRSLLASVRDAALTKNLASAKELDDIDQRLSEIAADQVFGRLPDMIATWKRKPIG